MQQSKYPTHAITLIREIMNSGIMAAFYTDAEILLKVNDRLEPNKNICYRTFMRYKAAASVYSEMEIEAQQRFDPIYQGIHKTLQHSQLEHKETLVQAMVTTTGAESRNYKWLLERRFPEFNLRINTKRFLEKEAEQKQMMEEDLLEAHEAAKAPKPVPTEKPFEQLRFEREVKEELMETREVNELEGFREYWDEVQQQWDTANPLQAGHVFSLELENTMMDYYRAAMHQWKNRNAQQRESVAA